MGTATVSVEQLITYRHLITLPDGLRVLPGHGDATTIAKERFWLDDVKATRRLPY